MTTLRQLPELRAKELWEKQRDRDYNPIPENIFKTLRKQHGLTLNEMGNLIHISKQGLIRLEQGTYEQPLPSVLQWWGNHVCGASNCPSNQSDIRTGLPIGELRIRDAYAFYQSQTRRHYSKVFGRTLLFNSHEYSQCSSGLLHPLRILRNRGYNDQIPFNVTEIAKFLCIPQATIDHFEKKYRTQQSVPKNLKYALREVGYTGQDIGNLGLYYEKFREITRNMRAS